MSFGAELTVNNNMPNYFQKGFALNQHNAGLCNVLQHAATPATQSATQSATCFQKGFALNQHNADLCNILQHTATYCNMLQHTTR